MPPTKKTKKTHKYRDEGPATTKQTLMRVAARKLRGRRGSLELMPHIPVDVILEILSHLHPRDLISLARTSQAFRNLLLNRNNAFIWRESRMALPSPLPDPSPLLSEAALAHLMFSPHCHDCGKSPVHKIVWPWLKRYCSQCLSPMKSGAPEVVARMICAGLDRIPDSLSVSGLRKVLTPIGYHCHDHFHTPQVDQFELQLHKAAGDLEALTKTCKDQQVHVATVEKLAGELEGWARQDKKQRDLEEEQSRVQRMTDVLSRLKDAGWGPELEYHASRIRTDRAGPARSLYSRGMVAKLTDREWIKINGSLREYMDALRRTRLSEQTLLIFRGIEAVLTAYHASYASPSFPKFLWSNLTPVPTAIDIAWMIEGAELFVDHGSMAATDAHLQSLPARVPDLAALWEERMKEYLRERVSALCPPIPVGIDPLDLAIAVFGCAKCESQGSAGPTLVLRFSDILIHACFNIYNEWYPAEWPLPITHEYQDVICTRELRKLHPRCPIVPERISIAPAQRAYDLLVAAHCDPTRVLFSEVRKWEMREGLLIPPSAKARASMPDSEPPPNLG